MSEWEWHNRKDAMPPVGIWVLVANSQGHWTQGVLEFHRGMYSFNQSEPLIEGEIIWWSFVPDVPEEVA